VGKRRESCPGRGVEGSVGEERGGEEQRVVKGGKGRNGLRKERRMGVCKSGQGG